MFFLILGVVVGLAVAIGPLKFLQAPADRFSDSLVNALERELQLLLGKVPYLAHEQKLVTTLSVVLGVIGPGLASLGLILLARASIKLRRAMTSLCFVAAVAGLFLLPAATSVPLLVGVVIVGAIASLLSGSLVSAPLAGLATVIGVRYGILIWDGQSGPIATGAATLAQMSGVAQLALWKLLLTVLGLVPLASAAILALKTNSSSPLKR